SRSGDAWKRHGDGPLRAPCPDRRRRACGCRQVLSSASSPSLHLRACEEARGDGELVGGEAHGFTSGVFPDTGDLVDHAAGPNDGYPSLDRALAATLTNFEWLLGDRLVREDADPEFAAAADVAGDGAAAGLELAGGEPTGPERLEAILAEGNVIAGGRDASPAAAMGFAELRPLRL